MIKNVFDKAVTDEIISRINLLSIESKPKWGKMDVARMLAHCNVTYTTTFTPEEFKKPNFLMKFMLKSFVKKTVVGEKMYKPNGPTSPIFIIANERDFEKEKALLIANIQKVQNLGATYFEGKENYSFGILTSKEWNNMFYKHLEHHLTQFGV